MPLITRAGKGDKLSIEEMDNNLLYLESANAPIDITYSALYTAITTETLIPGSWYRLTDYKNVNFLNGWEIANNNPTPVDPSFIPREIYEGETEVLLLQAISSSEISPIGYSEDFPQDIVTYLPLVNSIGIPLEITNSNTLPDSSVVSGFELQWDGTNVYFNMPTGYPALYGHYFYLSCTFNGGSNTIGGTYEPLNLNRICQYPDSVIMPRIKLENGGTKVVLLDLTEQDYLDYDVDTLSVTTVYAIGDAYGWITRRQDTQNRIDVPFDFRNKVYRRYECEILGNITSISYTATGTTAVDNTYNNLGPNSDTSTDGQNATFKVTVLSGVVINVEILNEGRLYANGDTLTIDGTQIGGTSGVDDVVITVNSIDSNIGYWGIGDVFNGANTTGNYQDFLSLDWRNYQIFNLEINTQGGADMYYYNGYCENVFLGNVYDCKIGSYFYNNTIGGGFTNNTIGDNFNYNTIGDSFASNNIENDFTSNTIGFSFGSNTIGGGFTNNTIGNSFNTNTIGINFNSNTIGYGFQVNTIGYTFYLNTIGDNFNSNTIRNGFQTNSIGTLFQYNAIGNDFTSNIIGDSFDTNTIGDNFSQNTIGDGFINNFIKTQFGQTTIGDNFQKNSFGDNTNGNTIGNSFQSNAIGNSFQGNTIGNNFSQNTIGDIFQSNTIGDSFNNNTIGNDFNQNIIGDDFLFNTIGSGFGNTIGDFFQANTIGNNFQSNAIGDEFRYNIIGDIFNSNTIGNDFRWNTIKYIVQSTDFSLATYVYADYNCEIFRRSDSTLRLSYIDGTDTIQYAAITD